MSITLGAIKHMEARGKSNLSQFLQYLPQKSQFVWILTLHCDLFDHNLIFDFNCYCQHPWFCFWQSMTEFRRIPQLEYNTAFHFFDMKYESYCLEIWHYWDNTQYMLIKVYYYDKLIKSSKVETVSVINTSMCVYFCFLKMLLLL